MTALGHLVLHMAGLAVGDRHRPLAITFANPDRGERRFQHAPDQPATDSNRLSDATPQRCLNEQMFPENFPHVGTEQYSLLTPSKTGWGKRNEHRRTSPPIGSSVNPKSKPLFAKLPQGKYGTIQNYQNIVNCLHSSMSGRLIDSL